MVSACFLFGFSIFGFSNFTYRFPFTPIFILNKFRYNSPFPLIVSKQCRFPTHSTYVNTRTFAWLILIYEDDSSYSSSQLSHSLDFSLICFSLSWIAFRLLIVSYLFHDYQRRFLIKNKHYTKKYKGRRDTIFITCLVIRNWTGFILFHI